MALPLRAAMRTSIRPSVPLPLRLNSRHDGWKNSTTLGRAPCISPRAQYYKLAQCRYRRQARYITTYIFQQCLATGFSSFTCHICSVDYWSIHNSPPIKYPPICSKNNKAFIDIDSAPVLKYHTGHITCNTPTVVNFPRTHIHTHRETDRNTPLS